MAEVTVYDGKRLAVGAAIVAIVGAIVLAIGLAVDPGRAFLSYLWAYVFAFTIAFGALVFLCIGYAANARWMAVVRRTTEIVALPLPALVVLFVPIVFGLAWLYPWHTPPAGMPHHELEVLAHRAPYLNTAAFVIRAIVVFALLLVAAELLRRWSRRRDGNTATVVDPVAALGRERGFASAMLPITGLAFTVAVIDWAMSLNGVWYSSMFPVNAFAGGFLAAIALITVLTARLRDPAVTPNHFHALGRMLFAFTVFWAYTAFFQAMLMWIADKPEEIVFFARRTEGTWAAFAGILVLGHFALPFFYLLPRGPKFRRRAMAIAGWWLLAMHLVDTYWLVIPSHVPGRLVVHWLDLAALAVVGGAVVATAAWRQHRVALLATGDPFFADGAAYRSPT